MKEWEVIISEPAESDIDGIYTHIAEVLIEPVIAWKQVERIYTAASTLNNMPERCPLIKDEPWRSRGLRQLFADNYTIIYEIQDDLDTVAVVAALYSRRNISEVLKQEGR